MLGETEGGVLKLFCRFNGKVWRKPVAGHEARRREDAPGRGFRSERRKITYHHRLKTNNQLKRSKTDKHEVIKDINSEPRGVERRGGRDRKGGGVRDDNPSLS